MAIEFIAAASTFQAASSVISISRPSGSTAGDLLVAHIFVEDNTDRVTSTRVPAGWSTAVNQTVGTRAIRQYVHYKVLTTTEPSSYDWYLDAADEVVGMISAYRGADLSLPIGNIAVSTVNAQSTNVVAPEITVQTAGNWAVMCAGNAAGSTAAAKWTPPTSFTERVEIQTSTGGANISAVLADYSPASTGATGAKTYVTAVGDYYVASLVEIKQFEALVNLTVTDGACVSAAEVASLSQEQNISAVENGAGVQAVEAVDLIQEHNLVAADGAVANSGETLTLEVLSPAGDITLFASDYISAAAADPTTAQLTAPAGKDAGTDFQAGLISDDTNPLPAIDLGSDKYTEIEFCLKAGPGASGNYEFRITSNGTALTAYLQTPTLTVGITDTLSVADGYSVSVADTASLEQEHLLTATDAAVVSVVEAVDLLQEHNLTATDAAVVVVSESAVLEQEHVATIADGIVKAVADTAILSQEHNLVAVDSAVVVVAEVAQLSQEHNLVAVDSAVKAVADDSVLEQEHVATISDGIVKAVADVEALLQEHNLDLADGVVKTVGDVIAIGTEGLDTLSLSDGVVKTVSEVADLIQEHNLSLSDGAVQAVADTVDVISAGTDLLAVQDAAVKSVADSAQLSEEQNLVVLDANSQAVVDALVLLQEHVLETSDCYNPNHVDNVDLEIEHWLEISAVAVQAAADKVGIYSFTLGEIVDPYILSVTPNRSMETLSPYWYMQSLSRKLSIISKSPEYGLESINKKILRSK